jgi:hypothetical protein
MRLVDRTSVRRLGFSWHLQCCLSWIPDGDLFGIDELVLEEKIEPATAKSPEWHHTAERDNLLVEGQYFGKQGKKRPTIALYIATIYQGIPKAYWLSPVITLRLAHVLAHEVGHHLIQERGYVFARGERFNEDEYEEEFANRYSFSVRKRMFSRWYYRFGDWLRRDLADWYWVLGGLDWKDGCYERAAAKWRLAFSLDPNRVEASQWYHAAVGAALRGRPSQG